MRLSQTLHLLTRFLDGLKPPVRVLVAIQQPQSLDTAYTMALLYEELGDGSTPLNTTHNTPAAPRRAHAYPLPPPPPPTKWVSKSVEEKKQAESSRSGSDDRWSSLKQYRRSKGLCFICGEKWGIDHQCKASIQLHVVQEIIECMQPWDSASSSVNEDTSPDQQLLMLSAMSLNTSAPTVKSMKLRVTV